MFDADDVKEGAAFCQAHGEPFNENGCRELLDAHGGRLPLRIKAVPEGSVVPTHNVLMTVENTDPRFFWLVSWVETPADAALVPDHRCDAELPHQAHDPRVPERNERRSARRGALQAPRLRRSGRELRESAGIGGMAHLVNFQGSDTIEGVRFANHYYEHPMAAFSIPAAEHSTITMWGRERELEAYRNMVRNYARPGALFACVSDSYDLWSTLENVWGGELRDEVEKSGATLVVRPDSGNPAGVVLRTLQILERKVGAPKTCGASRSCRGGCGSSRATVSTTTRSRRSSPR